MTVPPRIAPLGDSALTLELGHTIDAELSARVRALDDALRERPFDGYRESVPTYRSLLVVYDPLRLSFAEVRQELLRRATAPASEPARCALHRIPTRYGGEEGPDLPDVAKARGLSEDAVVALHSGCEYTALMLGFMPGFAYLGLLPPTLETPRRPTPRARVPAGSVAIAARQTGIYPWSSPGGWSLLGRTSVRLFDPQADPPALILPGDRVRFDPVTQLAARPGPASSMSAPAAAAVEVIEGGLLTTVQDVGRFGLRRLGVAWAGAMDAAAQRRANAAVGNTPAAACLECVVAGPTLRITATTRFAVAGGDLGAVLHRADLGAWPVPTGQSVLARPGNVLAFGGRRSGCRAYVAFAGGIDVPVTLGSRATDLGAGFGGIEGRALKAGDRLALGRPSPQVREHSTRAQAYADDVTLRVVLGPQQDHFGGESLARFLTQSYTVAATSDRIGCRLQGEPLRHLASAEILSDGMLPGTIQVPADGQPIVMMADAPTTGGYPKIATVASVDLPLLAQLLPGEGRVRFAAVSVEEAQDLLRAAAAG